MFDDLGGGGDSDDEDMDGGKGNGKKRMGDREFKNKGKVHKDKLLNKRSQKEAKKSKKVNQ